MRELWVEVVFVALLLSAGAAMLGVAPRLESETASLVVLFLSYLAVLGSVTFLILRSTLAGWWLAVVAVLAAGGGRLLADGVERVLSGASPAAVARVLAVQGGLIAAGVVIVVLLARGWRRSPLRLRRSEVVAATPAGAALAVAYALGYVLAVWGLSAAGVTYRGTAAPGLSHLVLAGLARGVVMVACSVPLVLTLLGRRVKNSLGVGALLGLAGIAAHLAAARSLAGEMLAGAVVQGLLGFVLGVALVRLTRPPLVERESSSERAAVQEEESPGTPAA